MQESHKAPPAADNDQASPETPDPEIEALLQFEPVPRKVKRPDGWNPERQREFIRRLARCGSPSDAANQMGKCVSGIEAVYKEKGATGFRAAWDAALEIGWRRMAEMNAGEPFDGRAPGLNVRGVPPSQRPRGDDDNDDDDDQASLQARGEEARDSITNKLLGARRLYLQEISGCPGKRAAFEILTQYPIDWDRAARCEAQDDEPWRSPNMREPEMLLTAENGWMGDMVHGPDKKAELRKALDKHHAAEGLPPIQWEGKERKRGE